MAEHWVTNQPWRLLPSRLGGGITALISHVFRVIISARMTLQKGDRKMKVAIVCVLLAFLLANSTPLTGQETLADFAKARLKAAEKAYREFVSSEIDGLRDYKMHYSLSKRLVEAQRDLDSSKENELRAFEAHYNRMVDLEKTIEKRIRGGYISPPARFEGQYYLIEARFWLEKAKAKLKK
jgi:hypothetical protein